MNEKEIAIIGGGPAGSTLASLLRKRGFKVGLIDDKSEREIFVGESLIPAIMPLIYELGIEEEMKPFSFYKPGASVWLDNETVASIGFDKGEGTLPPYAYQTERKHFDKLLLKTAIKNGTFVVSGKAGLKIKEGEKLELDKETLALFGDFFSGQPDLIVDASGRKRLIPNLLKLETRVGKRKDKALFAHFEGVEFTQGIGNIHMHICDKGWSWRIPLQGKTSVGIVADRNYLAEFGTNNEDQYDNVIKQDTRLSPFLKDAKRISGIQQYSNYQMETAKLYGPNWVLAGDTAGFLDPVFSSGLYLAMTNPMRIAKALDESEDYQLLDYQKDWNQELTSWKKMIEIWYNGRLFTTYLVGQDRMKTLIGRKIEPHVVKHFTRIFTGEAVHSQYSMWLLKFMSGNLLDLMKRTGMHHHNYQSLAI